MELTAFDKDERKLKAEGINFEAWGRTIKILWAHTGPVGELMSHTTLLVVIHVEGNGLGLKVKLFNKHIFQQISTLQI
jgi:hypothetical protein